MTKAKLFEDFPNISAKEWREKIEADLKGADFEKKLVWKSDEGFNIQPYYRQEDLNNLALRDPGFHQSLFLKNKETIDNDWKIKQDFKLSSSLEECNCKIKGAISRGIQSVGLDLENRNDIGPEFLEKLLNEINLEKVEFYFMNGSLSDKLYDSLLSRIKKSAQNENLVSGSLGLDPLGDLTKNGEINEKLFDSIAEWIREGTKALPLFRIITLDAGIFQDGGSTLSQELGFGLAMANSYMDELTNRGLKPDSIANSTSFSFVSGPNYFMEIAKLRASRWLWYSICQAWGINESEIKMHIQTRSASWNLTLYDPNVNMLRTTTEAMSASLGGSDVITLHPFDITYREQSDFSSRVARNTQLILKEESHFDKVADPAAGSYYIEQLTESIAAQAWKHFLETEQNGGFIEAAESGWLKKQISASAEIKKINARTRRQSILGVNQYPNFTEFANSHEFSSIASESIKKTKYPAIIPFRISEEIEKLRLQTEESGKRPKVFLLKFGAAAWSSARAMFSGNFFACAGYEIIDKPQCMSLEDEIKAVIRAKADIVVICSSDSEYLQLGPAVFEAINKRAEIVIAGYPEDSIDQLKAIGLQHFIHMKSNLLDELRIFQNKLNISK